MPKTLMYFGNLTFWGAKLTIISAKAKQHSSRCICLSKTQGHLGGIFCVSNVKKMQREYMYWFFRDIWPNIVYFSKTI